MNFENFLKNVRSTKIPQCVHIIIGFKDNTNTTIYDGDLRDMPYSIVTQYCNEQVIHFISRYSGSYYDVYIGFATDFIKRVKESAENSEN